ncbi:MAG: hypothetical protein OXH05_04145 [Acidobacteria bacterium]|nr:hypothetical protein [Acidobacteriota bacterium]
MSPEVLAILGVGVSLAAFNLAMHRSLRADLGARMDRLEARMDRIEARMDRLEAAIHALGERVARLEGAVPFLTPRALPDPEQPQPQTTA